MSKEYQDYTSSLNEHLDTIYEIAKRARAKGLDPDSKPETEMAEDLAGLVEGFIGPPGVAERIRELSENMPREEVAFKIAEEIVYGRFGHLEEGEAADQAVRTAAAILTEGVTAAVYSEGIANVSIKSNPDRSRYLAIYFAGPIRSAGGTETALIPVIAEFVRRLLGLDRYKPTEDEIERFIEELRLYEREVGRFQYHVSDAEIRKTLQYLPVEVTGTQSNPVEVSSFRNLPRVETNGVRGGALRVVNDGIIGRSAKVLAVVEDLRVQGWGWLKDIRETQMKKSAGFMEDVPAGRPILSFPSRRGGFRLRYGRARNTGLAAVGLHPLTMTVLRNFIAGGTQLRIETPGKSGIALPVDTIEPPVVRLKDGSVVVVSHENITGIREKIDKILFLGDLLISFGDFLNNNKALLRSGYTEGWWREELKASIEGKFKGSMEDAAKSTGVSSPELEALLDDPFGNKPTTREAIAIGRALRIPLHPLYTYFWSSISIEELELLQRWSLSCSAKSAVSFPSGLRGPVEGYTKRILEKLCVPFQVTENEILIEGDTAFVLTYSLGLHDRESRIDSSKTVLENLEKLSGLRVKDKAPSFIGARVGRPEKAKKREMRPPVHVLFPVSLSGGPQRNLVKASEKSVVSLELAKRRCPKCQTPTFKRSCENCGSETRFEAVCPRCGRSIDEPVCPICKAPTRNFERQLINIKEMFEGACERVGFTPSRVKGVKGLINRTKTPEMIVKGVLRAKHNLSVYKDGTIRFDVTNAPLTHFKPSEIAVSVERLKELGYYHDCEGNQLVDPEQICELRLQDVIIPQESVDYLISVANFVDELLEKVYGLRPYYNVEKPEDLIGQLVIGLAPHTCAGVLGRIIGTTKLDVCYAHPFWHSAKRRDCDGDEDSLLLALDVFLNFSKAYLPAQIGGSMDAPLFVIRLVNPKEVQRQAQEMDVAAKYPLDFYERTQERILAKETVEMIDILKHRLGTEAQFEGLGFTVPVSSINLGNRKSVYKTLTSMKEKLKGQLELAEMIEAVDAKEVAEIVLTAHFIRDIAGNLRAFTTQKFRCKKCNRSYRRIPLKGRCQQCGGGLTLTVHRGGIEKYLQDAQELVTEYGLPEYYAQRLSLVEHEIRSLFESGVGFRQSNLADFLRS